MKTKMSLFVLLFGAAALSAANRTVNLASFTGATNYTTVTDALAAAVGGDTVFVAAGVYAEAELTIPAGVIVIGGLPAAALVSSERIYPGKAGITTAQQTTLNGGGGFGATPHRVATVNGTLDGCVVLNGFSATQGGGVLINTTGTVQNCFIRGNQCHNKTNTGVGGGAYLLGSARLLNSVIDFNMAQQGFAIAGAGTAVNNTITNNCNAPTWIKIIAGIDNKFPFNDISGKAGTAKDTWFANDYYMAQTLTTVAQYAVFANATQVANSTTQKIFTTAEKANYNWTASVTGSVQLFAAQAWALQFLNTLWVANTGMETRPMETVTWYGSLAYSQWLGGGLPTEAEWEYAARRTATGYSNNTYAGTNLAVTTTSPGAQDYFWFGNSITLPTGNTISTKAVATKLPNEIGLYDMSGNVMEWCASWNSAALTYGADPIGATTGAARVNRGGSWNYTATYLAVTYRFSNAPAYLSNNFGFRPKVQ